MGIAPRMLTLIVGFLAVILVAYLAANQITEFATPANIYFILFMISVTAIYTIFKK